MRGIKNAKTFFKNHMNRFTPIYKKGNILPIISKVYFPGIP